MISRVIKNNSNIINTIVTIGTFDGVHIGHQKIIEDIVSEGLNRGLKTVVLTLFPHPRMVLQKDSNLKLLNTIEERINILKSFGVEDVVVKAFTTEFSQLSAYEYIQQILSEELNSKVVVVGYDHHFGKNRSGNIQVLKRFAQEFGFEVREIKAQQIEDVAVSSTKIRRALEDGDVRTANTYLGYEYPLSGVVIQGNKLGRTIGFPTANLEVNADYKLIPKDGVYVVKSSSKGNIIFGMMNIGSNPSFPNKGRSIEVHFFNFSEDLYNKSLDIRFLQRLRDEIKFDSVEDLKNQLQVDKKESLEFLNQEND